MWDVCLDAPLDSSGAGPSHVRFVRFHVWRFITLSQPKPLSASPGKGTLQSVLDSSYSVRVAATDTASLIAP